MLLVQKPHLEISNLDASRVKEKHHMRQSKLQSKLQIKLYFKTLGTHLVPVKVHDIYASPAPKSSQNSLKHLSLNTFFLPEQETFDRLIITVRGGNSGGKP